MKKTAIIFTAALFFYFPAFCQHSLENLLSGFLDNNLSIKKTTAEFNKQNLSYNSTKLNNSFSIGISTGTVTFSGGENFTFAMKPQATISLPGAGNLELSFSSNATSNSGIFSLSDNSISLGADILGSSAKKTKIANLKNQRSFLMAKRNLQNVFLEQEKVFYQNLKSLYQLQSKIATAQKNLYEDTLSFEQIKAQGYSSTSSKYRLAEMEVLSDQRDIDLYNREALRETRIFARKCGIKFSEGEEINAMDFLPETINSPEPVEFKNFSRADYTLIENVMWTNKINSLERAVNAPVSLSLNGGITFSNSDTANENSAKSNTVDAGINFGLYDSALKINLGTSIPMEKNSAPVFKTGITLNPTAFFTASSNRKINLFTIEQEELNLQEAYENYFQERIERNSKLDDLKWTSSTNLSSYKLYDQLEKDSLSYFNAGIISKSEYNSAQVNKNNYRINCLINAIDFYIYNIETTLLFNRDGEINEDQAE